MDKRTFIHIVGDGFCVSKHYMLLVENCLKPDQFIIPTAKTSLEIDDLLLLKLQFDLCIRAKLVEAVKYPNDKRVMLL